MPNPRIGETEFHQKGAAASAKIQKSKAKARWEQNKPKCLYCGKEWEWRDDRKGSYQLKRRYCDAKCIRAHQWAKYRERTGTEKKSPGSWFAETPFRKKGEVPSPMINQHARQVYLSKYPNAICELCGYDKIPVDVAHIKAVSSFSDESLLLEINQRRNLIGLCKNDHYLFDKGKIPLETITKKVEERESLRP